MGSWWESLRAFLRREAADIKQGMEALGDKLDAELTKREQELEATPTERIDMLRREMVTTEDVFDRIEAEIDARLDPTEDGDGPDPD